MRRSCSCVKVRLDRRVWHVVCAAHWSGAAVADPHGVACVAHGGDAVAVEATTQMEHTVDVAGVAQASLAGVVRSLFDNVPTLCATVIGGGED